MKNDNDIKRMFDNAVESGISTDIEAGRIKNNVMERLNKQVESSLKLSDGAETVKPVYVTESTKKSRRSPLIIAAAATAAACLSITAVSVGFFGRVRGIAALEGENPDDDADKAVTTVLETQAETKTEVPVTKVGNAETAPQQWTNPFKPAELDGERYPLLNSSFTLLDGTKIKIDVSNNEINEIITDIGTLDKWLLSQEGGRVYFWNGTEKKDVTDLFSDETVYVESYENKESGLTHYIMIGGDIATGKYGYAEVFAFGPEDWGFNMVCCYDEEMSKTDVEEYAEHQKKTYELVYNLLIKEIENISGREWLNYSGCNAWADFKKVSLPCDQ